MLTTEQRKQLAKVIKDDIDEFCATHYDEGMRKHLGGSLIGEPCQRKLWYGFRWVKHRKFNGRQRRLFNRGHLEEARFVHWLRGVGFDVHEFQDDGKTQYRISDLRGHFGGSLDGLTNLPLRYSELMGVALPPMLLEFKTSGTGKSFNDLALFGMKLQKPIHYAQTCSYGKRYGIRYVLYICINKNDDDIHLEIEELDWNLADQLTLKAERVITSPTPPERLHQNSAHFDCKTCDYADICHGQVPYEKNCRSCCNAIPVDDGKWHCRLFNQIIPDDFIAKGCDSYGEAREHGYTKAL